ncbi:MAG: AraC family transcriptional regulator [Clostridia bacterium]|nr:AraC family transcriptional regulator [Clostridia bacterium]
MKELRKKVSYLKGLMDGMELDEQSKEARIFREIIDVIEKITEALEDLQEDYEDLEEYLESIDEDLYDLEDEVYEDEEDEEDDDEENCIEVDCPKCQEIVCFDADILNDEDVVEVTCPNCDTVVFTNEDGEEKKMLTGESEDPED